MVSDKGNTQEQLLKELESARRRLAELEAHEARLNKPEDAPGQPNVIYSVLVEKGSDGVVVLQDGLVKFANAQAAALTGVTPQELIGRQWVDFVAPQYRQMTTERFGKRVAGEDVPGKYEIEIRHKNGMHIPVEANTSIIEYDGRPAVLSIARDITDRKRSEDRLRIAEQNFQNSFDDSPLGILIDTVDNEHLYANKALLDIYGFSGFEEFSAMPASRRLTPASLAAHQERMERRRQGKPVPSSYEISIIRKDGGIRHLLASRKELQWSGRTQLQVVFQDITDRKNAEQILRLQAELLDAESDSVDLHDFEGRFVYVNRAAHDMLGYTRLELLNMNVSQLDDDDSKARTPARLRELAEKGRVTFEVNHRHKNGSWIPLEVHASRLTIDGKDLIVSVARDVTERKRLHEQLMAQDRLASIGQLVAGVAHELNNPLTSVIGFSELLLERDLSDAVRADLEIVNREAQRTAAIVKNLLTFARSQPETKAPVDIREQLLRVLDLRRHEQSINNIRVTVRVAPDLPPVIGNASQLQQVFFNIVMNAEQSMLDGHDGGNLAVTTERVGAMVRVSVSDDGPGISHENMSRLFTPFFTTKGVGKGTGLGLSICHGIITEHGGRIYAESEPAKGATFTVELPIAQQ